MIVVRCYDVLGTPALKIEYHGQCCRSGTCSSEDSHGYEHATNIWPGGGAGARPQSTADVLCSMLHEHLSALGEEVLRDDLQNHLAAQAT